MLISLLGSPARFSSMFHPIQDLSTSGFLEFGSSVIVGILVIGAIMGIVSLIDDRLRKKQLLKKCKEDYMFEFYTSYQQQRTLIEQMYVDEYSHHESTSQSYEYKF